MHTLPLRAIALIAAVGCGDSQGPGTRLPVFAGTLDGVPWTADTAVALAFASSTDTSISITGVREVSAQEEQEVTLVLHAFGPPGDYVLSDTTGPAVAAFRISQIAGGTVTSTLVYLTGAQQPGSLTISSVNRTDSLVSGTFAFAAATTPDSTAHRQLAGRFQVRYSLTSVFP